MALRFLDSFDHYTNLAQKWTSVVGAGVNQMIVQSGTKRTGAQAMQNYGIAPGATNINLTLDAQVTWIIGFAFQPSAAPGAAFDICRTLDVGATQGALRINADLSVSLLRGAVVVATSVRALTGGTFQYLEFKHTVDPAAGLLEVRLNGVVIATFTGNTRATANTSANGIGIGQFNAGFSAINTFVDDIYILDGTGIAPNNAYWGDTAINMLKPSGAGNYTNWATLVGAATHWQAVTEVPPDEDTSYVADAVGSDEDSYTFGDLAITSAVINGIQVCIRAREDLVGGTQIKRLYRNSATDDLGAALTLTTSYQYFFEIMPTDTIASAAWTVATINSAEFGVDVV